MKKGFYITFLILLMASSLQAQRVQDWLLLGDKAMESEDYFGAMLYYKNAFELDSNKAEVNYKYAESLRFNNRYEEAVYFYSKIFQKEMGNLYPEGPFWLAMMQKQSGNYKDSKITWRFVQKMHKDYPDSYTYKKATQEIRACDIAMKITEESKNIPLEALSKMINTADSEFAAVLNSDSSVYFSSLRGEYNDKGEVLSPDYNLKVYRSDNIISAPAELNEIVNTKNKNVGNLSFGPSGKTVYYSVCEDYYPCRIWTADYINGQFQNARELQEINEDESSSTQPWMSQVDGKDVLFFSSDRDGSHGGFDLWFSEKTEDGFAEAVNCGGPVNSPGNEVSPYYDSEKGKLYFSSDWHYGLGGYDIFESEGRGKSWKMPQNLGLPFNSPANDLYFNLNYDLERGLFSSNRKNDTQSEDAVCCNDIFTFTFKTIRKKDSIPEITSLEQLNDYLPVTLYFHNDEPDPKTRKTNTNKNYLDTYYNYLLLLPEYEEKNAEQRNDVNADEAREAIDAFFIDKVDQGVKDLRLFSQLLAQELSEGERIEVTIKGYASPLAKTDYNVNLTQRRISSLINYFIEYDNGNLGPYINGESANAGELYFIEIPFGEYTADKVISDNAGDVDNSIYGISAVRERKIEIISVNRAVKDTIVAAITFDKEVIDLGEVDKGSTLDFIFSFRNTGERQLEIDSLISNCECIQLEISEQSLAPGESGNIKGVLNPGKLKGKHHFIVAIHNNSMVREKEVSLTLEVAEEK